MADRKKIEALAAALTAVLVDAIEGAASNGVAATAATEPAAAEAGGRKRNKGRSAPAAPTVTLEDVRKALIALNEAKDKQAVVEVLSRFGVAKIGDLPEENYAEAKELAEAEAAADDNPDDPDGDDPFAE